VIERLEHALVLVPQMMLLPFSRWQSREKLRISPGCSPALVNTWSWVRTDALPRLVE
jgi:hypothetical protein